MGNTATKKTSAEIDQLIQDAADSNPLYNKEQMIRKGYRLIEAREYIEQCNLNNGRKNNCIPEENISLWVLEKPALIYDDESSTADNSPSLDTESNVRISDNESSTLSSDSEAPTKAWPTVNIKKVRLDFNDTTTTTIYE